MSAPIAHHSAALQKLAIRLFFSERLQQRWSEDPEAVADEFGVPRGWMEYLPSVDTPRFKVEAWGRRLLIAREIHGRFSKGLTWATGEADPIAFARGDLFARFLDSEAFFSPRLAIPHAYGLAPGYENVTKFFAWLVEDQGLRGPFKARARSRTLTMRRKFYAAFGVHLVGLSRHSKSPFYKTLNSGAYFRDAPPDKICWRMIDAELRVTHLEGPAESVLKEAGLADIDSLLTLDDTRPTTT